MIKLQTVQEWNDSVDFANCLWVCYTYLYLDLFNLGWNKFQTNLHFFYQNMFIFHAHCPKSLTRNVLQKLGTNTERCWCENSNTSFLWLAYWILPTHPSMPMAKEGLGWDHHPGAGDWVGGWTKHQPKGHIMVTLAKFWSTLFQH